MSNLYYTLVHKNYGVHQRGRKELKDRLPISSKFCFDERDENFVLIKKGSKIRIPSYAYRLQ